MNPRDRHHLVCTKSRSRSKEWEEMVVQQASKNVWTLSKNSDYTYGLCSAEYLYLFVVWVQFVIWNPASGSLPVSWLFASGGPSIRALASVLLMNIQGWFPLGLTGWISLLSKGLSRVFSSTTVWKHQFFGAQPFFYDLTLTSTHDYWKSHSFA